METLGSSLANHKNPLNGLLSKDRAVEHISLFKVDLSKHQPLKIQTMVIGKLLPVEALV